MSNLQPASAIITRLGGDTVVAGILSLHRTRVANWKRPKEKGGTGGLVPQRHHRMLLDFAALHSVPLAPEDFLVPASLHESKEVAS